MCCSEVEERRRWCTQLRRLQFIPAFLACLLFALGACSNAGSSDKSADPSADATVDGAERPSDTSSTDASEVDQGSSVPCGDNPECAGVCVTGPHSLVCLQPCKGICPENTICKKAGVEGEFTDSACLPVSWELCRPCMGSSDCGFLADRCVLTEALESFCGLDCSQGRQCPNGFTCAAVSTVELGESVDQCVPMTYQCDCLPHHAGSSGVCYETSKWGECPGQRICNADGQWSSCDAAVPQQEECNGIDDNCDGVIDEGFADDDLDGIADCMDDDPDGDGVLEGDNCPAAFNPDQEDYDQDGEGDTCDADDDNDGWPDFYDCQPADETSFPGAEEVLDGVDNNCNGTVDEDGDSPVGNCGPGCFAQDAGPGQGEPFYMDEEHASGLSANEKGYLKLDKAQIPLGSIWIANSWSNNVSRLDTETGQEVGRYAVCMDPSRTAVDLEGNVWVACRGDGGVAKVRLFPYNCVDQDGDGEVETSQDVNDDGVITPSEMMDGVNEIDECLQFITYPGGSCQRAAGVDKENHAWIGEWNGYTLSRLEPEFGAVVQSINIPDRPYGLIIDGDGIIWVSGRGGGHLVRVDPETEFVDQLSPGTMWFEPYGISGDAAGRVWVASCFGENMVHRYDPADGSWASVAVGISPRGLVGHTNGQVYVALDSLSAVAMVDGDTMTLLSTMNLGSSRHPVGMSVDADGFVWAVNQMGNSVSRLHPDSLELLGEYPVGQGPYTYSDMTGFQLYNYTAPMGVYTHTFVAMEGVPALWTNLTVEILFPPGSTASLKLRAASSTEQFEQLAWQVEPEPLPDGPSSLDLTQYPELSGHMLQVQVTLFSGEDSASPLLKKLSATYVTGY